jgi:sugar/nucleoside kinase (ribokinase family)
LGWAAALLTRSAPLPGLDSVLKGITLRVVPAAETTTFENTYTASGRVQYLRAVAPPIPSDAVPPAWRAARVAHLGPVAQEVPPDLVEVFGPTTVVGVTPQGWLRAWDTTGRVRPAPWPDAARVLARADVLIFSAEDVGGDAAAVRRLAQMARLAVVTDHRNGCIVWERGRQRSYPAFDVQEVDPTGAGDTFTAAFLVRFADTRDGAAAARFANAAASFVVEGQGAAAMPTLDQVERRLQTGKLRA